MVDPDIVNSFRKVALLFYHSVRLDLGIIEPNLIFLSPELMREAVGDDVLMPFVAGGPMARMRVEEAVPQWQQDIQQMNDTLHAPAFSYLHPVWHRKPLASAIVSVYTATFTMVSLIWAAIRHVSTAIVNILHPNYTKSCSGCDQLENRLREQDHHLVAYDRRIRLMESRLQFNTPSVEGDGLQLTNFLEKRRIFSSDSASTLRTMVNSPEYVSLLHSVSGGFKAVDAENEDVYDYTESGNA
ncbi:hypothetical protein CYLTODRAFT_421832, partial [Cylindrobasidium torrendii FP15055 ss-10]